jgi:hypothetical protein
MAHHPHDPGRNLAWPGGVNPELPIPLQDHDVAAASPRSWRALAGGRVASAQNPDPVTNHDATGAHGRWAAVVMGWRASHDGRRS